MGHVPRATKSIYSAHFCVVTILLSNIANFMHMNDSFYRIVFQLYEKYDTLYST